MIIKNILKKKVFIIAEIGSNFDQNINKAFKLIDVAKESGADAVKFQLFRAEELYPKSSSAYKIFKSIELQKNWIPQLIKYAQKRKIIFFASAFDKKSILTLIKLKVQILKIASSEITKLHNLSYAASFDIPLIISTGMANLTDITEAVDLCRNIGNNNIYLLHTSSLYPTLPSDVNMKHMTKLGKIFDLPVGFSDHTMSSVAAIAAVALSAKIIEKHITLDKNSSGPDHFYAAEPNEFRKYVRDIREAEKILGKKSIVINPKVKAQARRKSIFVSKNVNKNEIITKKNLIIMDNARGIETRYMMSLLGFKFNNKIKKNSPLDWKYINFKK